MGWYGGAERGAQLDRSFLNFMHCSSFVGVKHASWAPISRTHTHITDDESVCVFFCSFLVDEFQIVGSFLFFSFLFGMHTNTCARTWHRKCRFEYIETHNYTRHFCCMRCVALDSVCRDINCTRENEEHVKTYDILYWMRERLSSLCIYQKIHFNVKQQQMKKRSEKERRKRRKKKQHTNVDYYAPDGAKEHRTIEWKKRQHTYIQPITHSITLFRFGNEQKKTSTHTNTHTHKFCSKTKEIVTIDEMRPTERCKNKSEKKTQFIMYRMSTW